MFATCPSPGGPEQLKEGFLWGKRMGEGAGRERGEGSFFMVTYIKFLKNKQVALETISQNH